MDLLQMLEETRKGHFLRIELNKVSLIPVNIFSVKLNL